MSLETKSLYELQLILSTLKETTHPNIAQSGSKEVIIRRLSKLPESAIEAAQQHQKQVEEARAREFAARDRNISNEFIAFVKGYLEYRKSRTHQKLLELCEKHKGIVNDTTEGYFHRIPFLKGRLADEKYFPVFDCLLSFAVIGALKSAKVYGTTEDEVDTLFEEYVAQL